MQVAWASQRSIKPMQQELHTTAAEQLSGLIHSMYCCHSGMVTAHMQQAQQYSMQCLACVLLLPAALCMVHFVLHA